MRFHTSLTRVAAICLVATRVAAQEGSGCPASPGAAFGVVGYQCANCGFSRVKGQRASFSFMAEPVIVESVDGSKILAGDVIEAVNGNPITTRAGSDAFTYPSAGDNTVTVRRGRDHQTMRISVPEAALGDACDRGSGTATGRGAGVGTGAGTGVGAGAVRTIRIRGTSRIDGSTPVYVVDGVVMSGAAASAAPPGGVSASRFGFAVACEPSCTAATDVDGPLMYTYYKYDGTPPIVAIRAGSPADRAGVKMGDLLVRIDGRSIVDPDGALALARIDKKESVRVTIRRDGKEFEYVLNAVR